jgi:glucokinase
MLQDPELIVLAGGLAEAGDVLLRPLRAAVTEQLAWRTAPRIEVSPLAGRAGRYGIAIRAWQAVGLGDAAVAGWTGQVTP